MADPSQSSSNSDFAPPPNNRIAVLGPSHASFHFAGFSDPLVGTTPYPSGSAQGMVNWANFLSGGRAICEAQDCFGYIGDLSGPGTNAQGSQVPGILSRADAVVQSGAGHCVLVAPWANDVGIDQDVATSITNVQQIIDKLTTAGMRLTIITDFPHGDATSTAQTLLNSAASPRLDRWQRLNRWLLSLNGQNGVRVVNGVRALADVARYDGRALSGMLVDGLHVTQLAAFAIGRALAREWNQIYPPFAGMPLGNSEVANQAGVNAQPLQSANPYFAGTSGTVGSGNSGSLGDGWSSSPANGLVAVYSQPTTTSFDGRAYSDGDGALSKSWQQIALSGTATATGEVLIVRRTVLCTAGDVLRAVAEIEVDAGVTGLSTIGLYVWQSAGNPPAYAQAGQFRLLNSATSPTSRVWPNYPVAGILLTPRWTNESAQYNLCLMARTISGAAIGGTIRVRGFGAGKSLVG